MLNREPKTDPTDLGSLDRAALQLWVRDAPWRRGTLWLWNEIAEEVREKYRDDARAVLHAAGVPGEVG